MFPEPRFVETNGVRLAVFEAKPAERTKDVCVVLCHGFPELGFSWRHQLRPLAEAGYHVMAPDLRGYGQSNGPTDPEAYNMAEITQDVAGLIADAGYEKAVVAGHDFGGFVSWTIPFYQPKSVAGVITLNTPFAYIPKDPEQLYLELYGPRNYVAYFKTQQCEEELNQDTQRSFRFFMRRDAGSGTNLSRSGKHDPESMSFIHWLKDDEKSWPGEVFLKNDELDYFAKAYAKRGFGGGLNWYRSIRKNWEVQGQAFPKGQPPRVTVPALMICARNDYICDPSMTDNLPQICDDVERHIIENCGHWTQQEQPAETNRIMIDWLTRKFG
jgi:soluble epoxide hydrolase/lipid-phosphate phosphatase